MEQVRFIDNSPATHSMNEPAHRAPRALLLAIYAAALAAVRGRAAVAHALMERPAVGPTRVLAIGKAAESMTLGALDALGAACAGGLAIGKHPAEQGARLEANGIAYLQGGHPLPTQASLAAGERLLAELAGMAPGNRVLFLISGGASSLVEVPVTGLGLVELRRINEWLLGSGLPIGEVNRVRGALSRIKAGGLLHLLPTRELRVLAISDVPGDDPAVIGSGLLVPGALPPVEVADPPLPDWIAHWVRRGTAERGPVPPRSPPWSPPVELVATLGMAKDAAAAAAREHDVPVILEPGLVAGDAAERGKQLARELAAGPPGVRVWGGETTVRLPERAGRGGRNQHLALAAAVELAGRDDCWLLAAGTDGSDGDTDDAGALVDGGTLERAALDGYEGMACLERADAGSLLAASGDLIQTGPTGTNVMDLMLGYKAMRIGC
jgi:hydroxypyruvate reductase